MRKLFLIIVTFILSINFLSVVSSANWKIKNSETYYIDTNGDYTIGWAEINGKTYYFKSNGAMITKSCVINGLRYKFTSDGVCHGKYTGWTKSATGRRYYKNGVMITEKWIKTKSGKRYYADNDGYMRTGWARVDGKICFFDEKGVWDGKKYYNGYKPKSMKYFLMDFKFPNDVEYECSVNYGKYKDFDSINVVKEILENDSNTIFLFDVFSGDSIEMNEHIYHGGKQIIIRCSPDTNSIDAIPHIVFTKDKKGNSYFYCTKYGFGCKLSDSKAYDVILELIS